MQHFDVIVIGAGPAGATAAYHLAKNGVKVALIDKEKFPRDKLCGGMFAQPTLDLLDFKDFDFKIFKPQRIRFSFKNEDLTTPELDRNSFFLAHRKEFDYYLLKKAVEKGAKLYEGVCFQNIISEENTTIVETDQDCFQCNFIVSAEGAASLTKKRLNLAQCTKNPAFEVTAKNIYSLDSVQFDFGIAPKGYLWVFPKEDQVLIGLGTFSKKKTSLHTILKDFLNQQKYSDYEIKGHPIPIFEKNNTYYHKNILFAGDAAGLVDPFLGEGIRYAILSGKMAAETIINHPDNLAIYQDSINTALKNHFTYAKILANLFYNFPKVSYNLAIQHKNGLKRMYEVMIGQLTYQELFYKLLKQPFKKLIAKRKY